MKSSDTKTDGIDSVYIVRRRETESSASAPRIDMALEQRALVEALFGPEATAKAFAAHANREATTAAAGKAPPKQGLTALGRFNIEYDGEFIRLYPAEQGFIRAFCNPDYDHAHEPGAGQNQDLWGCIFHANDKPLGNFLYALGFDVAKWGRRPVVIESGVMIIDPRVVLEVRGRVKAVERAGNKTVPAPAKPKSKASAADRLRSVRTSSGVTYDETAGVWRGPKVTVIED